MSGVIDTLAVVFTAELGPLAQQISEMDGMLRGVGAASRAADASLRSMAGALDFSMGALRSGAHSAGAAVGARFAEGLRSKKGAVDSAVKYLTSSALAALNRLLGGGKGAGAGAGTGASPAPVAAVARLDEGALAGGSGGPAEAKISSITIPINLDGVKLGEACIKGLSQVSKLTGRGMIEL